jgi:myo-inositol-1-phosphate synthase
MGNRKLGLWLVGAQGGVATTVAVGLAALRHKLCRSWGLVSELPPFAQLDLAAWDQIVLGGHEIRQTSSLAEARQMLATNRVFEPSLLDSVADDLRDVDQRVRPGALYRSGAAIESLASARFAKSFFTPRQAIAAIQHDLAEFMANGRLERVIVINLASTEPAIIPDSLPRAWEALDRMLDSADCPLPASSLYAIAALESGMGYVNFTPSVGSDLTALDELALLRRVGHMGRDGKTGETLLKSVLAPMFAARNLEVMSWVGHNIIGNLDGKILDDPLNKQSKVASKDHLLKQILAYDPQTLVTIEYIRSLGDWKTAWDHIHFRGFLATPMTLQFTWQGCDSLLAAPLVLDLFRFAELAARRGAVGTMPWLACFFKSPMSVGEHSFAAQFQMLLDWAAKPTGAESTAGSASCSANRREY